MTSRKTTVRLGLVALLAVSILGVSTVVATVAGPSSTADAPAEQIDRDVMNEDCPLCEITPGPIEPITPVTAPCDATCVEQNGIPAN